MSPVRPPRHWWFLPTSPDVLSLLAAQGAISVEATDAFSRWAHGAGDAGDEVRDLEHRADGARRAVVAALRAAFSTPIGPEDLFELSERLDAIVNQAKDLVRESEVLAMAPDDSIAQMASLIAVGTAALVDSIPRIGRDPDAATAGADRALHHVRDLERRYRTAMSTLLEVADVREVGCRRELYRRCSRIGEAIERVADRIWYAVVKQT